MKGEMVFSKIDLIFVYRQLWNKEEYIPKIVFNTRFRHYDFTILLFGLMTAPGVLMSLMNGAFHE
jgi:hypothetical protein